MAHPLGDIIHAGESYAKEAQLMNAAQSQSPTIKQNLERQKAELEQRLDSVSKAIQFLNENPNFELFSDLLRKIY
jgi:hypothetical protein